MQTTAAIGTVRGRSEFGYSKDAKHIQRKFTTIPMPMRLEISASREFIDLVRPELFLTYTCALDVGGFPVDIFYRQSLRVVRT